MYSDEDDDRVYRVVVNDEEQYSIWFDCHAIPLGWNVTGKAGTIAVCLASMKKVWTDMRPINIRKQMD